MKDSAAMKSKRWFLSINLIHYLKTCGTSENLYWLMTLQKRVECLINEREIIRLEKEILLSNYMDGLLLVIVDVSRDPKPDCFLWKVAVVIQIKTVKKLLHIRYGIREKRLMAYQWKKFLFMIISYHKLLIKLYLHVRSQHIWNNCFKFFYYLLVWVVCYKSCTVRDNKLLENVALEYFLQVFDSN